MVKRILYVFLSFILLGVFSMAIILPSAHIYNTNNPKVRDNNVGNVSVENTVVAPNNDYETPIHNANGDNFDAPSTTKIKARSNYSITSGGGVVGWTRYELYASYVELSTTYSLPINIIFDRIIDDGYISKIYDKANIDGEPNIKHTVYQDIIEEEIELYVSGLVNSMQQGEGDLFERATSIEERVIKTTEYGSSNAIPQDFIKSEQGQVVVSNTAGEGSNAVTASLSENYLQNIIVGQESTEDYGIINGIKILCGATITKLGYSYYAQSATASSPPKTVTLTGKRTKYIPKRYEITIYGDTISIDLTDGTATYGSGGKPFSLERNELLQDSATTYGKPTTEYLANRVLSEYANGKETATVLVSVSEYYDENGNLVISTKKNDLPMTFRIGDLVIPMVRGADGKDYPMSRYKDGSAKVFRVVGRKPYFDGAVWQELSLQEFDKANLS